MRALIPWIEPLGLIWLFLTAGWIVFAVRRRWAPAVWLFLPWLLLTLTTCIPLPSLLLYQLEQRIPPAQPDQIERCDAIICLGGGIEPAPHEPTGLHQKRASDRLTAALLLCHRHGVRHLILGGGAYGGDPDWRSEADDIATLLSELSIPGLEVHSLGACAHTRDEALKVRALSASRSWKSLGLVTSAGHMPRAAATFRKAGINVYPIPCNYLSSHMRVGQLNWFHAPGREGLQILHDWLHEVLGMWFYGRNEWI